MSYNVPKPNSRVYSTILSSILSSDYCHQPNKGVEVHVHDALESEIFDAQTGTHGKFAHYFQAPFLTKPQLGRVLLI